MKVAILGRGMVGMLMANELSRRANIECEIITPDNFPSTQVWQVKTMSREKCTGRKSDRKRNRANRWRRVMSKSFKNGDKVTLPNHDFLSDGAIKKIHFSAVSSKPFAATVKLDEKAPNEYAWETDEVFMYFSDMELVDGD